MDAFSMTQPRLAAAAEATAMPLAVFSRHEGTVLEANQAFLDLTLLTDETLEDLPSDALFITGPDGSATPLISSLFTAPLSARRGEACLRRVDGRVLDVAYSTAQFQQAGEALIAVTLNDITAEKCLTCKIHISREKYRRVVDDQPDLLCRFQADTTVMFANEAFATVFGLAPHELVGRRLVDLLGADRAGALQAWMDGLSPSDHLSDSGETFELPGDATDAFWWRRRAIFDPTGQLVAVQSMGRADTKAPAASPPATITTAERHRRALSRLRDSEEHHRRVFAALDEGVAVFDHTGRTIQINPAAERLLGLPPGWAVGRKAGDLDLCFRDTDGRRISNRRLPLARALRDGHRIEGSALSIQDENDTPRWLRVNAQPILLAGHARAGALVSFADITEIKMAAHRLRSAKMDAETANATKTQFLANMSHELRTPLNAILGYTEAIHCGMFGPVENPRHREYLGIIHGSGEHLMRLIDDILEISRIEMGELRLHVADVDVAGLTGEVRDLLATRAEAAEVALSVWSSPDVGIWRGDRHRLLQVLLNLGSNGIKFTPAGGEVSIHLFRAPDHALIIEVRDTGVGIAPDQQDLVWEPFRQVQEALTRSHDGAGLGLPIVRSLIEAHGGAVAMDSTPGAGTTITARLPRQGNPAKAMVPKWATPRPDA